MPRLEYDVVFTINTKSVETLEQNLNKISSGGGSKAIQKTENEVKELNVQLDRTAASADEAKQALQGISSGTTRLSNSMQGVNQQQETFNKTANNSNQILFSFGDAMQDGAQFSQGFGAGMRAVGNNLTFASEQIAIMTAKAGSGKAAMKSLAGAMFGPAGLIFAFNAAVTAVTLWAQSADKAKREAEELNVELKKTEDFLKEITKQKIGEFVDSFEDTQNQLDAVNRAIDNLVGDLGEGVDLMGQLENINKSNKKEFQETGRILDKSIGFLKQEDRSLSDIEEKAFKILQNKRAELRAQQEVNKALRGTLSTTTDQFNITNSQISSLLGWVREINRINALNLRQINQLDSQRAAGFIPDETAIQRETRRLAEFLNITESQAKKRFQIEKDLADSKVDIHEDVEEAKTAITEAQSRARRNRTLTAIQSVGMGLTQLFQKQKGVAIAGAVIDAGAAIVRQYKDLPLWAAIPSAALVAAKTAKQIQQIKGVEPGDSNVSGMGSGGVSEGFTTTDIDRTPRQEPNGRVAQQAGRNQGDININLQTEADSRVISKKATQGRKEIDSNVTAKVRSES